MTQKETREKAPTCPRCQVAMVPIAHVDSFGGQPALEAFECPKCRNVVSRLTEVHGGTHMR